MKRLSQVTYFDAPLSHGFITLYISRLIVLITPALLGIFVPIFLYLSFGENIYYLLAFFLVASLLYVVVMPAAMPILNKIGFRRSLIISSIAGALLYYLYYLLEENVTIAIIVALIITILIFRIFYWLPFHVSFTLLGDRQNRSRQISVIAATEMILKIFLPVIAGIVIAGYGFNILFFVASVALIVTIIPYSLLPRTSQNYTWSYRQTWRELFSSKNTSFVLAYLAIGIENTISILIWPIVIFGIVEGSYLEVGALSTLIMLATALLQLFFGRYIDKTMKKKKTLRVGSTLYSLGWLGKAFITTAVDIFIAGIYHRIVSVFTMTPFNAIAYDISADQGHYIDELTALREMAVHLGRIVTIIVIALLTLVVTLQWVFLIGVAAALGLNLIKQGEIHLTQRI